ncbi:MAG: class I SAM-dependent methyltransferase [Burkholderiales bacterium]|nr:class I SAM-dependent methyltransferase [Burkholderiales bacterium]
METSHWHRYAGRRELFEPPLRPHADVVALLRTLVGAGAGPVLLLGVTAAIAEAFPTVEAVDKSPAMVARSWPGDTASRRATIGDWLDLGASDRRYAGIVGDGSLNMLTPGQIGRLLAIVAGLLERPCARSCARASAGRSRTTIPRRRSA